MPAPYPPDAYAVLLLRISTDQTRQDSLPRQESMGRGVADRLGLPVREVFVDEMSRSLWPRPGIASALAATADPLCVAVITWEGSRTWGDVAQQTEVFETLEDNVADLYDRSGEWLNAPGEVARFKQGLDALLAQMEVSRIRRRVYETHTERVKGDPHKGVPPQFISRPPFGFRFVEGEGIIRWEPELQHIRSALRWIVTEGASLNECANRLEALGVVQSSGKPFNKDHLGRTLRNRLYVGEMIWNRRMTVRRGGQKRIVVRPESEWITRPSPFGNAVAEPHDCTDDCAPCAEARALYDRAIQIMESRKWQRVDGDDCRRFYSNVVRCGKCGRKMPTVIDRKSTPGVNYYNVQCSKRQGYCQTSTSYSERKLLRVIEQAINAEQIDQAVVRIALEDTDDTSTERDTLKARIVEALAERKELRVQLRKGRITEEEFDEDAAELNAAINFAESRLAELDRAATAETERAVLLDARTRMRAAFPTLIDERIPVGRRQVAFEKGVQAIIIDKPNPPQVIFRR